MEKKQPSQLQEKFTVRFPDGMRDKIAELADKNNRSMNSEILFILNQYIESKEKITNFAGKEYKKAFASTLELDDSFYESYVAKLVDATVNLAEAMTDPAKKLLIKEYVAKNKADIDKKIEEAAGKPEK